MFIRFHWLFADALPVDELLYSTELWNLSVFEPSGETYTRGHHWGVIVGLWGAAASTAVIICRNEFKIKGILWEC